MAEDPFKSIGEELKRAMEEHAALFREEMERVREHMQTAMERMKADMVRARTEFEQRMNDARRDAEASGWSTPDDYLPPRKRSRRPPRKPRGGEPAPVKPRPNPTPLTDGAEVPIE